MQDILLFPQSRNLQVSTPANAAPCHHFIKRHFKVAQDFRQIRLTIMYRFIYSWNFILFLLVSVKFDLFILKNLLY